MIEQQETNHHTDRGRPDSRSLSEQLVRTGSQVDHYRLCYGLIKAPDIDADRLAWIFTYIRLFSIKDVKLGMRHNYQTKDISHIQSELTMALAGVYAGSLSPDHTEGGPLGRVFIRNMVNFIPRGGGNGDELRLFILDVMRRHGIREGHRPGIDDPFLEEWHQKLHSNCTPEDITICEAYIAFQKTNSHDLFYKTLWERGGISRDFLRNMARPLTHSPRYMPQLIPDLEHLLWILKQIHGGSHNFHYLVGVSGWQFDQELGSRLEEVKNHFGAWWIPGKIVDCRKRLKAYLRSGCPRDPLMIDVALDNIYKTAIEQIDLRQLSGDDLIALLSLTLQNLQLSYDHETTGFCLDLWERMKAAPDRWSHEWGLQALAGLTYIQAVVHSFTDELYESLQPKAMILGRSCEINQSYITNFAEEVIRSQSTFSCSKLIDALFPILRQAAGIGCWKVISNGRGEATGTIKMVDSMLSVQGSRLEEPHILLVNKIDGLEDIPTWASAILTRSDVDILAHISIRCRNLKVILATCHDQDEFEKIRLHEGEQGTIVIRHGQVSYRGEVSCHAEASSEEHDIEPIEPVTPTRASRGGSSRRGSGSKSGNLLNLKGKLSEFINLPCSITVPFEAFERTLQHNQESFLLFDTLATELSSYQQDYSSRLSRIRELIANLTIPAEVMQSIHEDMLKSKGLMNKSWSASLEEAITVSIKRVWGSVWNERAYLSRLSRRISGDRIRMGVLIQKVIPADYAFIIHTCHPVSHKRNEMLSEIVVGLGETLAGNSPGSPLSVISKKGGEPSHAIISYPSKRIACFDSNQDGSYIIRSDSNDEDLPDFSGAGLYDSYFTSQPVRTLIPYDRERLFWDKDFQHVLLDSLVSIAEEIEGVMACPQDIEGVYAAGSFYVVQTRHQIIS
ncbi:MAG: phosphohistidine-like domain-containing protein [bacterium]